MVIGYLLFDALIPAGINDKSPFTNHQSPILFCFCELIRSKKHLSLVNGEW